MKNIRVEELYKKIQDGEIDLKSVIDVRTEAENKTEKIICTINVPLNRIQNSNFDLEKGEPFYIYCATGNRSQVACHLLEKRGFSNCYNVEGGIEEWKRQGFETKGNKKLFGLF